MLCPDCQTEIPIAPDADVQICRNCQSRSKRKRRAPKLRPRQNVRYRVDQAHQGTLAEIRTQEVDPELVSYVGSWLSIQSSIHVAVFGLLTFLVGQSLHVWAFWSGNYPAWTVANMLTATGVCVSIFAFAVTLRNFERRIEALAKMVGRRSSNPRPSNQSPGSEQSSPRLSNKKMRSRSQQS